MKCESCKRIINDGEHCYGPKEYEGQIGPRWVLCLRCARNSTYDLISVDGETGK